MNRVGGGEQVAVAAFADLRGEISLVRGVLIGEGPHDSIALGTALLGGDRLKEAPPHDLKALGAGGWSPLVGKAGDDVLEAIAGGFAIAAANLVAALGHGDQQQGIGYLLGGLGELLGEGELGVKGAGR